MRRRNRRTQIIFWVFSLLVITSMCLGLVGTLGTPGRVTPTPVPTWTPLPTRTPTPPPA